MPPIVLSSAGENAVGKSIAVTAAGQILLLAMPEHMELAGATLEIAAAPGDSELTASPSALTLTTDQGVLAWDEKKNEGKGDWDWPTTSVPWIAVDWGQRRPLTSISVQSPASSPARLKISEGGGWFPPAPIEVIALNAENRIPGVMASRVMVEMLAAGANNVLLPARAQIGGITVKAADQPQGLSLAIGEEPPFFTRAGPLLAGQKVSVPGLAEAVNRALPADGGKTQVPLVLRAEVPGKVTITLFSAKTVSVKRTLDGAGRSARMPLPWGEPAVGRIDIGARSELLEVSFKLQESLAAERLQLSPLLRSAEPLPTASAHLCDATHAAAQSFAPLPAGMPLAGVDCYLRPLTRAVTGTLTLYPDAVGRPAQLPFPGTGVDFTLAESGAGPWTARWVACSLPRPLLLGNAPWWAVLTVTAGEALWYLADAAPPGALGTGYRVGAGSWLPRSVAGSTSAPWAMAHLRVPQAEPPPPAVRLRRGELNLPVVLAEGGMVALEGSALEPLNAASGEAPTLEIVFTAASAGEVTVSDLTLRWQEP